MIITFDYLYLENDWHIIKQNARYTSENVMHRVYLI